MYVLVKEKGKRKACQNSELGPSVMRKKIQRPAKAEQTAKFFVRSGLEKTYFIKQFQIQMRQLAVSSINLRVETHLCKPRDTPAACYV